MMDTQTAAISHEMLITVVLQSTFVNEAGRPPCYRRRREDGPGLMKAAGSRNPAIESPAGAEPMARDAEADEPERISRLLAEWANRDPAARERLVPIVYEELRRLAHHYMRGERPDHTLQTTALVNEAYMRLAGIDGLQWRDRAHFFAMAATLMRRVLVDYARQRARDKRGAGVSVTSLDENAIAPQPAVDVVALDEALQQLAAVDPRQSRIVELRFFAGLSVEETAEALGISEATVKRDWATARLWLYNELMTG
jgi:RNA polymerase sigma-70 factor, ECF subfamily